jgi:hypothetical protein
MTKERKKRTKYSYQDEGLLDSKTGFTKDGTGPPATWSSRGGISIDERTKITTCPLV